MNAVFWEVPDGLCPFLSVDLSSNVGTEVIDKLSGNTFGAVTRIRPIIIITFGTIGTVVFNGVTFDTGIGAASCDHDIITVVLCQDIVTRSTIPKW